GVISFAVMSAMLMVESILTALTQDAGEVDELLGSRTLTDETTEALEAVAMAHASGERRA
ncbi:MAG: hypothetical protein RIS83_1570, partial [Pseudomonadota bacterium]